VQLGAESRGKLIAAVVLMVLAVGFLANWLFGGPDSAPAATPPAASASVSTPSPAASGPSAIKIKKARGKKSEALPRSLDPSLRYDWLKASEDTKYEGNGRNIFLAQAEPPPVPMGTGATDHAKVEPPVDPGPPPPPPINLKFFGFANQAGGPKKIFLEQGEDIWVAHEGDIVNRRYKVLHIAPNSVEVEDVLNNNRQSIPLTQG
jgi:hypothetical protein